MYIAKEAFLTLLFYKRAGVFSIMRRQFVPCPSECSAASVGDLLAELRDFTDQRVDLLLLANDDLVQLVEQVFIETGLDLQVGQAMVDDVGRLHAVLDTFWLKPPHVIDRRLRGFDVMLISQP